MIEKCHIQKIVGYNIQLNKEPNYCLVKLVFKEKVMKT